MIFACYKRSVMLIGLVIGLIGFSLACLDTKNYHNVEFKLWDTIRNQGLKLQYWNRRTDSIGTYTRWNLQATTDESQAYEVIFETNNFIRPRDDENMLFMVNGQGDFIKYDLAGYRNEKFGLSGNNTNNMFITELGQIYCIYGGKTYYLMSDGSNSKWKSNPNDRTFTIDNAYSAVIQPSELTKKSHTHILDCTDIPHFYEFSDFTTRFSQCPLTSINIYEDQSKKEHSKLEIIQSNGKNIVRVKNAEDRYVEAEYKFYICIRVADIVDIWASAEDSNEFTLKTELNNQLTYPNELKNKKVDFLLDCVSIPSFYQFGAFTQSQKDCLVVDIAIHSDKDKTVHDKLEVSEDGGMYTVKVKNKEDYQKQNTYLFYIVVSVGQSMSEVLTEYYVKVENSEELELNVFMNNSLINPVELTTNNYTFVITGREKPHFYLFGEFKTTQETCLVLETNIYAYKNKTSHTKLQLVKSQEQWFISVPAKELLEVQNNYTFYINTVIGNGDQILTEYWASVNDLDEFLLIAYSPCKYYISFTQWEAPSSIHGTIGGNITIQREGNLYFSTTDNVKCRITNYQLILIEGDQELITLNHQTGKLHAQAVQQYYQFNITACGAFSLLQDDCVTTNTFSVFIDMGESPAILDEEAEDEEEEQEKKQVTQQVPLFLEFEKKQEAYKVPEPFKIENKPKKYKEPEKMHARIIKIDQFGLVKLKFYDNIHNPLKQNLLKSHFNEDQISIKILPASLRPKGFDQSILSMYEWKLKSFDQNSLIAKLQLNFSQPLQISQFGEPEHIELKFITKVFKVNLEKDSFVLNEKLPLQIPNTETQKKISETAETQSQLGQILLVLSILIYLIVSFDKSSHYMIIMIRALQLITHFPLIKLVFQGNVINQFEIMLPLLQFDILDSVMKWEDQTLLKFDKIALEQFRKSFQSQAQDIGYDSHNSIMILNTIAFVILFYLIKVAIYYLLRFYHYITCNKVICKYSLKVKEFQKWLQKRLFFSELHTIYFEGIMEIQIAIILTVKYGSLNPFGEFLSFLLAAFSFLVIYLQIPFSYIMLFCHKKSVMQEDQRFAQAYGTLVGEVRQKTTAQRLYYAVVLLRRILYICMALVITSLSFTFQFYSLYFFSVAIIIFKGYTEPLANKLDRRIESFNELIVGQCTICLMPLTDWNQNPEDKFNYSWILIGLMQLLILVNSYVIFNESYHSLVLLGKKYKHLFIIKYFNRLQKKKVEFIKNKRLIALKCKIMSLNQQVKNEITFFDEQSENSSSELSVSQLQRFQTIQIDRKSIVNDSTNEKINSTIQKYNQSIKQVKFSQIDEVEQSDDQEKIGFKLEEEKKEQNPKQEEVEEKQEQDQVNFNDQIGVIQKSEPELEKQDLEAQMENKNDDNQVIEEKDNNSSQYQNILKQTNLFSQEKFIELQNIEKELNISFQDDQFEMQQPKIQHEFQKNVDKKLRQFQEKSDHFNMDEVEYNISRKLQEMKKEEEKFFEEQDQKLREMRIEREVGELARKMKQHQ